MKQSRQKSEAGFSLIEMLTAMVVTLLLFAIVSAVLMSAFGTRRRESRRADAINSARAALNVMSREISNAGYGLTTNGLIVADSDAHKLRFRTNVENNNSSTNSPGEDVTYFLDAANQSVVRFDPNATPQASVVLGGVSEVNFKYLDYTGSSSTPAESLTPSNNTGKVKINVVVRLADGEADTEGQVVSFTSEITLRNSKYMLKLY